jgi:putative SOS response-associated peptidase YedK
MPVILTAADYQRSLDPKTTREDAEQLLRPVAGDELTAFRVSTFVNSPRNNDPRCLEPMRP